MNEKIEVSVGKLEVQVERLEQDMSELKGDVKAIRATLDETKGSWKMLLVVGGFAAAVGGLITKVITVWPFK
jgi:multidrug efflux pump subunit AcrA (membrane-fusion protein)